VHIHGQGGRHNSQSGCSKAQSQYACIPCAPAIDPPAGSMQRVQADAARVVDEGDRSPLHKRMERARCQRARTCALTLPVLFDLDSCFHCKLY